MAKPDPLLLDPSRYPHSVAITPRYGDLDTNRHINNIAMSAMFEDARLRFTVDAVGRLKLDLAIMVVSLSVDYFAQTHYPHPVVFHGAVTKVGRSSVETLQLATQLDVPVALCRTVFVTTDGQRAIAMARHAADALAAQGLRS
jgi:acyl-CoA thioester hydrolase